MVIGGGWSGRGGAGIGARNAVSDQINRQFKMNTPNVHTFM